MSIKHRLTLFAKSKERSVRSFEIKTGLNTGYINAMRVSMQPDKLEKIISTYPDLNAEWLLTGKGAMFKEGSLINPSNNPTNSEETNKEIERLRNGLDLAYEKIKQLESEIESLRKQLDIANQKTVT